MVAFRNPTTRFAHCCALDEVEIEYLNSLKPWEKDQWSLKIKNAAQNTQVKAIKDEFKTQLEIIQDNYCAFCGLYLPLAHKVQREHIAPQHKHPHYIFEPENIVLACLFCNDHKGTRLTVVNDTNDYSTTTFKILHPFRDNFCDYLECDLINRELIFSIRKGLTDEQTQKAKNTIECMGLIKPHLIRLRGSIIFCALFPVDTDENERIKEIMSKNRKAT